MRFQMKRGEFGYFYRGYYIERCPSNQWNIWFPTPPARLEGDIRLLEMSTVDHAELIDEGLRSLADARKEIDSYLEGK